MDQQPTRETWRQFCQEPELSTEERARHDQILKMATDTQLAALMDATEEEYKATMTHNTTWESLARWADADRRLYRAVLVAWEEIKEKPR